MTRNETVDLLHLVSAAYPTFKPDSISDTVKLWQIMFADKSYNDLQVALYAYISDHKFPPTPADIIEKLNGLKHLATGDQLSAMEAWALVSKAIRRGGYYYREDYEALPELAKQAIGSPEQIHQYAIDSEYNEGVAQSNFIRAYDRAVNRQKEIEALPAQCKQLLQLVEENANDIRAITDKAAL